MDKVGISITGTLLTGLRDEFTGAGSFAALKTLYENRIQQAAGHLTGSHTAAKAVTTGFFLIIWSRRTGELVVDPLDYIQKVFLEAKKRKLCGVPGNRSLFQ